MPAAFSLLDVLREQAERRGSARAYAFLADGEQPGPWLTYEGLEQQVRALAGALQSAGARGERVLLLLPPGLDFVRAFFGCLYAGAVAVPFYAPHPARLGEALSRIAGVLSDAEARYVLTSAAYLDRRAACPGAATLPAARWIALEGVEAASDAWRDPGVGAGELAFLQYTSGSTSNPRGVLVRHGNLLANLGAMHRQVGLTPAHEALIWLPPYHDMGLIGGILQPLFSGFPVALLSPTHFLQRPARWLEAISRQRAVISGGPNFAYDLCVRRVTAEQREGLDLRSWTVAFSGAEPVRAATLDRFAEAFAPCGFERRAFFPCYGLAESTLFVSGGPVAEPPIVTRFATEALGRGIAAPVGGERAGRALVACGVPAADACVAIVEPATGRRSAEGSVGEVWIAGPSVAGGYWRRPEESRQTFGARLEGDPESPTFLRTGDLGFLHGGQLYVVGRLRDLIIVRGRNHYPQDIERTSEAAHPSLRPGGVAAFGVEDEDEERLVLVQEIEGGDGLAAAAEAIRTAVVEAHEVQPHAVVLVRPGQVPRTTSGKVRRQACKAAFLAGGLDVLWDARRSAGRAAIDVAVDATQAPEAPLFTWLRERVAALLGVAASAVPLEAPLTQLGLDSLQTLELSHALEEKTGAALPLERLLEGPSLAQLARTLEAAGDRGPAPAAEPRADDETQLSHGQRSMWFLHQLAPESPAYNVARAFQLRGPLDAAALRRAFQALLERHAVLRTTYAAVDGEPAARTRNDAVLAFESIDASGWSEAQLAERLAEEARRPFDLENGPVFHLHLLRRADDDHVLLLAAHHIAVDFWSFTVLLDELGRLYAGRPLTTPSSPPYAAFVGWQQQLLEAAEGERLRSFWHHTLAGLLPTLELPVDRPRVAGRSPRGGSESFGLDAAASTRLRALAQAEGVTLYTVLLAVFQTLLQRATGAEDLLVGTPTTGRSRARFAEGVGYYVNPVALRTDVGGDPPFRELLGRTRRTVQSALAHQDYPFARLALELAIDRDPGRTPLVQVMFVLQSTHRPGLQALSGLAVGAAEGELDLGGLRLTSWPLAEPGAPFDVTLTLAEVGGRIAGTLHYDASLFAAETMQRLARHFRSLVAAVVDDPSQRLSELPLLDAAERERVCVEWNRTATAYARDRAVHELFAEQAAATPDAIAVDDGSERLTYAALDRRANALAWRLRTTGVADEAPVAVLMERSAAVPVALLAVLKAGGCYVPLDPAQPRERLCRLIAETGARLVLGDRPLLEGLGAEGPGPRLAVEPSAAEEAPDAPASGSSGLSLAYVMFTSGSTGEPKGIAVPHRGIVRLVRDTRYVRFGSEETFLLLAPLGFDASTFEIWGALLNGGRLAIAPPGPVDLHGLGALLRERGVTTLWLTAGLFHQMAAEQLEALGALRQLLAGGDVLWVPQVRAVLERHPHLQLIDGYGPTEGTTFSCTHPITAEDLDAPAIPIGRPIANTCAYVLDEQMRPVPVGLPGELYVGGDGLARGYHGRPDFTAERFVPNPFAAEAGGRLYRTGDNVRWRADGRLEFLGRRDQQVKVRGFRVEPAEVEAALARHPGIAHCAVVARRDAGGEKQLVAYVVPRNGVLTAAGLRSHARALLPEAFVPSQWVSLERLPLTASGKVDRRSLPEPERRRDGGQPAVAPRTPLEQALAGLWLDVLGTDVVGVQDNFFELGGHSLRATQLVSRVQRLFQVELPLSELFATPTVEGLAGALLARGDASRLERIARIANRVRSMSAEEAAAALREGPQPAGGAA